MRVLGCFAPIERPLLDKYTGGMYRLLEKLLLKIVVASSNSYAVGTCSPIGVLKVGFGEVGFAMKSLVRANQQSKKIKE